MSKDIGKNVSKNLSSKYGPGIFAARQNLLDHAEESARDALKTDSKRAIQKTTEATGDLIGNESGYKITKC